MSTKPKAYLVGGGIGSLAAAAFMIRDGGMPGENISILEAMPVLGGSLDGAEVQPGSCRRFARPADGPCR
ncbi:oleate hydratase [Rhodanobacter terrae]|uniref:Oleate hydratase n=1 Tax=Rhodanobacter terrae TaxID=418647 RepID=A0ABW0T1E7_9GAMM